ncbi:E3 ubiquitin-protein ligase arih2 [Pichia californica]|uniref:E3 ubiquitin-protein ligase arih2 n=1 Tax=Pichia californica TaxID=460514 RepID=A0A9P6WNA6_9ASCO|nr:E3 ubiquitin-protein ligase arih2 [[Candida] californica]
MSQNPLLEVKQQPPILNINDSQLLNSKDPKTRESSPEIKSNSKPNNNNNNNNNNNDQSIIFKTPDPKNNKSQDGRLIRSSTICSNSGSKSPIRRHLRTMSITNSNPSSVCNSATNSSTTRKGINIGINLVGPVPTNLSSISSSLSSSNKEKDSFKTPRRKLFITKDNNNNNNNNNNSNNNNLLSSPPLGEFANEQLLETNQRSSIETNNTDISSIINSSPTSITPSKTNKTININNQQDELSENFRLLASKEMEILEIKNQLKYLLQKRKDKEFELQQLKLKIEKQLMNNLKQQNNEQYKHRFDQHTPKSPTSIHKSIMKPATSNIDPLLDESFIPISTNNTNTNNKSFETDKRQSWFSKPLNFIQQFDNLIYKEFEKLQIPDDYENEEDKLNTNKDLKEINAPIKSLAGDDDFNNNNSTQSSDVMQSVSQHLWSFVNDVKSNLLIEEDEPETLKTSKIIVNKSPSPLKQQQEKNLKIEENQKNLLRTASISKRQSYSQHNHNHRRRLSQNTTTSPISSNTNNNSSNDKSYGLSSEFTKDGINNVIRNISQNKQIDDGNGNDNGDNEDNTSELKTANLTITNVIQDEDLWDSEPLDI